MWSTPRVRGISAEVQTGELAQPQLMPGCRAGRHAELGDRYRKAPGRRHHTAQGASRTHRHVGAGDRSGRSVAGRPAANSVPLPLVVATDTESAGEGDAAARREAFTAARARRTVFLLVGLAPSLWLLRRMPIGFFFMAGGWTAIIAGIALVATTLSYVKRSTPGLRRAALILACALILGLALLAMIPVSRADARGQAPVVSDHVVRLLALVAQGCVAAWALNADRLRNCRRQARDVAAYGSAILTVTLGVFLGRRLPAWVVVPIVALVAVRFAWLPTPDEDDLQMDRRRDAVTTTLFFTWTVGVLALQTQLLATLAGLAAVTAAFGIGVVVLLRLLRAGTGPTARALGAAFVAFMVVMFAFVLLMPSLTGGRYLLQIGLDRAPAMTVAGTTVDNSLVTRWYATDLAQRDALKVIGDSFRSPPVSVWPSKDGSTATGLLFGYRLEARYYDRGQRIGAPSPCSTELSACVGVAVRRSSS